MATVHLDSPATLGTLLDALRPSVSLTLEAAPGVASSPLLQSGAIRTVFVDVTPIDDEAALTSSIERATEHSCEAIVLTEVQPALLAEERFVLPVIALRPGKEFSWVRERIESMDRVDRDVRLLPEEHSRLSITEIADRAAAELGGHIIVEDEAFQLLAHSRMTDDADVARREAVLQRQLPGPYQQIFNTQGVLARLIAGEDIVHTERVASAGLGQRLVAAIRHHGRLLGSIWLARDTPAFTAEDAAVLRGAAAEMAVLLAALIRVRDDERMRRDEAVASLLSGQVLASPLISLGHGAPDVSRPGHVIAMTEVPLPTTRHRVEAEGIRVLADVTARSGRAAVLTTTVNDVALMLHFGCDAEANDCTAGSSLALAERLTESFAGMGATVALAIGRHWSTTSGIPASGQDATDMVAEMRARRRAGLSTLTELWGTLTVSDLLPTIASESPLPPPVKHLFDSNARSSEQRRALRIILDHWGDVAITAKLLGVHPNTVRYRLQRLRATLHVDLHDADTRLALWILLRAFE